MITEVNGAAPETAVLPEIESPWKWALPNGLEVEPDPLRLRLDFHTQVVVLSTYQEPGTGSVKIVSAQDVAHALASELTVSTGILPANTLWWTNTRQGALIALWQEPKVRRLALQERALEAPERFDIPMPGLIFICSPGRAPWVYAAKKRPTKPTDKVYQCPTFNVFSSGRACPGTHEFPQEVGKIPDSFFRSFFSPTGDLRGRSKAYDNDLKKRWETLRGRDKYPMGDLIEHARVQDLLSVDWDDR